MLKLNRTIQIATCPKIFCDILASSFYIRLKTKVELKKSKRAQGWHLQQLPKRIEGEVPEMPGVEEDLAPMSTDCRKTFFASHPY